MTLKYTLKTALTGLRTNKSRSFLTILGIVIGIAAIILIASLGKGAQDLILNQIQGLGSKTIVVIPGREPKGPSDAAQIFSDSLKEKDITLLENKTNVPTLKTLIPLVFGGETAFYQDQAYRLTIFGSSPNIQSIFDLSVTKGDFFTDDDIRSRASVVVIGSKVKDELFGSGDAIGQRIKMKNRTFRVVGVMPKKGQVSFFNFDETAIVPYTTAQDYIFGIKNFHRFLIESQSDSTISATVRDVTQTLRDSHGITDPSKDDFFVQTQADLASRLSTITNILTFFLATVAGISLFVAGIGIMNIMLVSVTERTREIGLRKALGATEQNILLQFLFESILLTGLGGIVGIIVGSGLSLAVSTILSQFVGLGWTFSFPFSAAIMGLIVSAAVGLLFGLYPAHKASRKSPIEALSFE